MNIPEVMFHIKTLGGGKSIKMISAWVWFSKQCTNFAFGPILSSTIKILNHALEIMLHKFSYKWGPEFSFFLTVFIRVLS